MNKRFLLPLMLICLALGSWAEPVSKNQALTQASKFLSQKKSGWELTVAETPLQKARAKKGTSTPDYYHIFNIGHDEGFIIVSGDDRTVPILGYVDKGHFDADKMPDNARAWLEGYAQQISQLPANNPAVKGTLPSHNIIEPLIHSEWGQDPPYNNLCPEECVTGCVATAIAQIAYYYKWPAQTKKEIPAYFTKTNQFAVQSQPVTVFDWDDMKNEYMIYDTGAPADAVATLMSCCGKAVEMDYGPNGSSAYNDMIPIALKEYLDYSPNAREVARNRYSIVEWDALIYNELAQGRPVLYCGQASGSGHQFICDGYSGDGLYHINWGWDGWFNGDYALSVVNPNGSGIGGTSGYDGYSMDQRAIIDIEPNKGQTPISEEKNMTVEIMTYNNESEYTRTSKSSDFANVGIIYKLSNRTNETFGVVFAFALFQNGKMVKTITSSINGGDVPPNGAYYYGMSISFGSGMTGTYQLRPVCKINGSGTWTLPFGSDDYYLEVQITNTTMTLIPHEPIISLEGYGHYFTEARNIGEIAELNVGIRNLGSEFYGNLYLTVDGIIFYKSANPNDHSLDHTSGIGYELEEGGEGLAIFHYIPQKQDEELIVRLNHPTEGPIIYQAPAICESAELAGVRLGDANGDEKINTQDIVEIVKHIMGLPSYEYNHIGADANGDGTININIADIVKIVNKLLK